MTVFNDLLNRYKLFWPWTLLFGGSQWEGKSGHAMGIQQGWERHCIIKKEKKSAGDWKRKIRSIAWDPEIFIHFECCTLCLVMKDEARTIIQYSLQVSHIHVNFRVMCLSCSLVFQNFPSWTVKSMNVTFIYQNIKHTVCLHFPNSLYFFAEKWYQWI